MPAFLLSIREGLEAALIVSILLGALRRMDRLDLARYVWSGVASALFLSAAIAALLSIAGVEFEGQGEALFEGATLLLAAAVLTGMMFWMRRQGSQLGTRLAADVRRAAGARGTVQPQVTLGGLLRDGRANLFAVAFLAVLREGIELALLLAATALTTSMGSTLLGASLGLGVAALLGTLLFLGVVRLDLRRFFRLTNVLLIAFAAGMVGLSVHEFIEAGLLPALVDPVWNLTGILSDRSGAGELLRLLFGYHANPALAEVLAYCGYLLAIGWALLIRRASPVPAPGRS